MLALHQFGRSLRHVVAQIVKTEFVVRTESNVGIICGTALGGVRLCLVDTVNRYSVEHIQRAHPFRVTLGQVVVHSNHMHTVSGESIEKHRQRGHEGLTFTGSHFGNLSLVKNNTADELHIVVHHVPSDFVATGHPMVPVDGLIAVDAEEVLAMPGKIAVEIGGSNLDGLILLESASGFLHAGKHQRKFFVQLVFKAVEHLFFKFVDFSPERFALVVFEGFDFLFKFGNTAALVGNRFLYSSPCLGNFLAQFVVGYAEQ